MAIHEFDSRMNEIRKLLDEVALARPGHDTKLVHEKLSRALGFSCLLLRDIGNDEILGSANVDKRARTILKNLKKEGKFDDFVRLERTLLEQTKLEKLVVDEIILGLTYVTNEIIEGNEHGGEDWKIALTRLTEQVCKSASEEAQVNKYQTYLERAFWAAGGALIVVVDLVPPIPVSLPTSVVAISTTVGVNMLKWASDGLLDGLHLPATSSNASDDS